MLRGTLLLEPSNGYTIWNSSNNDVILKTTSEDQRVHIVTSRSNATLTITDKSMNIHTDVHMFGNKIVPQSSSNGIDIAGVRLANNSAYAEEIQSKNVSASDKLQLSYWDVVPTVTKLQFNYNTPNRNVLTIRQDGNVGINTENPQEKLHVNGNIRLENNAYVLGDLVINGNIVLCNDQFSMCNLFVSSFRTCNIATPNLKLAPTNQIYTENDTSNPNVVISSSNNIVFVTQKECARFIVMSNDCFFGVNTSNPAYTLDVKGSIFASSNVYCSRLETTNYNIETIDITTINAKYGDLKFNGQNINFGDRFQIASNGDLKFNGMAYFNDSASFRSGFIINNSNSDDPCLQLYNASRTAQLVLGSNASSNIEVGFVNNQGYIQAPNNPLTISPQGQPVGIATRNLTDERLRIDSTSSNIPLTSTTPLLSSGQLLSNLQWTSIGQPPQFITYMLSANAQISQYEIRPFAQDLSRTPSSWILNASTNGTQWTPIDSQSNITDWVPLMSKVFSIQKNKRMFRFYQLYITSTIVQSSMVYPAVDEFKLYSVRPLIFAQEGRLGLGTTEPTETLTIRNGSIMLEHEATQSKRGNAALYLDLSKSHSIEKQSSNTVITTAKTMGGIQFKRCTTNLFTSNDPGTVMMAFDENNKCGIGSNCEKPIFDLDVRGSLSVLKKIMKPTNGIQQTDVYFEPFGLGGGSITDGIYRINNNLGGSMLHHFINQSYERKTFMYVPSVNTLCVVTLMSEQTFTKEFAIRELDTNRFFHEIPGIALGRIIPVQLFNIGFYIDELNFVGINTTSPLCSLHVNGKSFLASNAHINDQLGVGIPLIRPIRGQIQMTNSSTREQIVFYEDASNIASIGFENGNFVFQVPTLSNAWSFQAQTPSNTYYEVMRIDSSNETFKIPYSTIIGTSSNVDTDHALYVDGTIFTTEGIYQTSDKDLKENIFPIEHATDKIECLNGYTFNYLGQKKRSAGVIAQEVKKVLPEAVFDKAGIQSVNYGSLIGLMIEGFKELKHEIDLIKKDMRFGLSQSSH